MVKLNSAVNLARVGISNLKAAPKTVATKTGQGVVAGSKKIATSSVIDRKGKDGNVQKTIGNLWTGKKINPVHLGLAGGAYLAGDAMLSGSQMNYQKPLELATMNNYQQQGAAEIMNYDGVAQQRAPQNLNATGDIVFGLHNGRKG